MIRYPVGSLSLSGRIPDITKMPQNKFTLLYLLKTEKITDKKLLANNLKVEALQNILTHCIMVCSKQYFNQTFTINATVYIWCIIIGVKLSNN